MTSKKTLIILVSVIAALAIALGVVLAVWLSGTNDGPGDEPQLIEGPENGAYYYDGGVEEYTLTLSAGNNFTLSIKGKVESGSYTVTDGNIVLDFAKDGKENVTASISDDVVTLTYEGATMRFLKKGTFTVSFNVDGGNAVDAQTVLNGKPAAKPADPTREGHVFIGWYSDSEYKTAYDFGTPVTSDITVYARWIEDALDGNEYTVSFDANYDGAPAIADAVTVGGKLLTLPAPERQGHEFKGWWYSSSYNGAELTYAYEQGSVVNSDTTLYALWQPVTSGSKLDDPVVNVTASAITWGAVDGARSYVVVITNADGVAVVEESTPATTLNVSFAGLDAGMYTVSVTALANTTDEDNSTAVRYYVNKALDRVTEFEVIDSMLIFNTVENAERYLITVKCGNPDHNHTSFDNGNSRTFNLANCPMPIDGIVITVTATAEGYASSTSEPFCHARRLDSVEGLRYDADTDTVHWDAVDNAAYYMVSVVCGNANHSHAFFNNGLNTFVELKGCDAKDGGVEVSVYPVTRGYASPEAVKILAAKSALAVPNGFKVSGTVISWNAVNGATGYELVINGTTHELTEPVFDLSAVIDGVEGSAYEIAVRAIGTVNSPYTDTVVALYKALDTAPEYDRGTLVWSPVIGADSYEIQVNDGEIVSITDGSLSARVALNKVGVNVVKLRFTEGKNISEWMSVEVFAFAVIFDTRGGSDVAVQYKAVGDVIDLPATEKLGYVFDAWYNVPGGPAVNGREYTDSIFAESGSIVLYAYYVPESYDVTYNYGIGGSGTLEKDSVSYECHYQLTVPTPANSTLVFGGWFTAPYGAGVQLTDAQGNSLAPWSTVGGDEVFAYWIDEALTFTKTKVNGVDGYMVSAGARIALLDEITIPETYNGLPVLMVAANAFNDCTSLKVINIPASLQQISMVDPFTGCTNLAAVNVVGESASARYWSKDGVLFDNGTGSVARPALIFMPLAKTGAYAIPDGITEIPALAFAGSQLSKITVPASVTTIGKSAFSGCNNLHTVVFAVDSENVQPLTIGDLAFQDCVALEEIMLPARLTSISLGKHSLYFEVDEEEHNVQIVEKNATHAFLGCEALTEITFAPGNATYKAVDGVIYSADGTTLIYCPTNVSGVFTVPAGTQVIAPGAFVGCQGITEVILPNTLKLVDTAAFAGLDDNLTKVTVSGNSFNDLKLGDYAFLACTELATVVLEEGSRLAEIGEGTFYGCDELVSFEVPSTMRKIGTEAFRESGLETITFANSETPLAFGERVFFECDIEVVHLPANVTEIPGIFLGCSKITEITVDESNPYLTSSEGVVFNKDMTELLYYPISKSGDYTVPATVKRIAPSAFANNEDIGALTIYTTLEQIGEHAFDGTEMVDIFFVAHDELPAAESLVICDYAFANARVGTGTGTRTHDLILPDNTKSIGRFAFFKTYFNKFSWGSGIETISPYAFYSNSYLGRYSDVILPETVTEIGEYTFYKCTYLSEITLHDKLTKIGDYAFSGSSDLASITIPASVTEIGVYAFQNCSDLTSVSFGEGSALTTIGAYAFNKCTKLTSITIPAKVSDIGAYAFAGNTKLAEVIFLESEDEANAPGLVLGSEYIYTELDNYGIAEVVIDRGHVFFAGNSSNNVLHTVQLPGRLVEIGEFSLYRAGLNATADVTLSLGTNSRLEVIGAHAFEQSNFGGELLLPATVQNQDPVVDSLIPYDRIGVGAFAFYQSSFEKITFADGGDKPLTIGELAFGHCNDLVEITLPARLSSYTSHDGSVLSALVGGSEVFGAGDRSYKNPSATIISDHSCGQLVAINAHGGDSAPYVSIDGVLYRTDGTNPVELVFCPINHDRAVVIPSTVTAIADIAFFNCAGVPSIVFEGGSAEMTIGERAFYGCSALESMVISDNVVYIGDGAFYGCSALTSVTLPANLQSFRGTIFSGASALANVYVGKNNVGVNYSSVDGILFTADMTSLTYYPAMHDATVFNIPGTVTVIGANTFAGNSLLQEVIIGEGVIEIRDQAFASSSIRKITIPSSVAFIGEGAFQSCAGLNEVVFVDEGNTPLVISDRAFYNNASLKKISFPARLVSIGKEAFSFNPNSIAGGLTEVNFAQNGNLYSIGDNAFTNTKLVEVHLPAGMTTMGDQVFYLCTSLTKVTFGEGVVSIGDQTFAGCTALTSVAFPASLRTMGINTFLQSTSKACSKLTKVTFAPNSCLEEIPAGTFAYTGITEIVIPASVKAISFLNTDKRTTGSSIVGSATIAVGAFDNCKSLVSVRFEDGSRCTSIGAYAFYECSSLGEISLSTSVASIAQQAFYKCTSLESVTIPASCTSFGVGVFESCTGLTSVVMNSRATALSESMFEGCSALKAIEIPGTVSSIGANCFSGTGLVSVVIPASVTDLSAARIFYGCSSLESVTILGPARVIGEEMFYNCRNLASIQLSEGVEVLSPGSFENCESLSGVLLPASLTTIESAFVGSGIAAYEVADGNTNFVAIDGVLFDLNKTKIIAYPANKTSESFTVPKEVVEIGEYTFEGITALRQIIFEEGGTANLVIKANAFKDCSGLISLVLPERLVDIGERAFYNCSSLVSVYLPSTLTDIEKEAFRNCNILEVGNFSAIELNLGDTTANGYIMYDAIYLYDAEGATLQFDDAEPVAIPGGAQALKISESGLVTMECGTDVYVVGYLGDSVNVVIPDGVTHVVNQAFYYSDVESVTLPETLVYIGYRAFASASSLKSINLPDGIEYIGEYAFQDCKAVTTKQALPASLKFIGTYAFSNFGAIDSIIVMPEGVEVIESNAFRNQNMQITFYVKAESAPAGWESGWDNKYTTEPKKHIVNYGFSGEEITYVFTEQVAEGEGTVYHTVTSNLPVDLPAAPEKDGFVFLGWIDADGNVITGASYYSSTATTLYASWMTEEEFNAMYAGTSRDHAIEAVNGASHTVIDDSTSVKGTIWFKVTANESVTLTITTNTVDTTNTSGIDTVIRIYDSYSASNEIVEMDDGLNGNYDEQITYTFEAGKTYYIEAQIYSAYKKGTLEVTVVPAA